MPASPDGRVTTPAPRVVIIGCGAIARELLALTRDVPGVKILAVDAKLHMRPERIAGAVEARIREVREQFGPDTRIFVGYADRGTAGTLDALLEREGVERIPGAHCYEFYAGTAAFERMQEEEIGTFYLTDFLAKHFDALVWGSLGLDRHPELRDAYFGNYRRIVLLSQGEDPAVVEAGRRAADMLGLEFEHVHVGRGPFAEAVSVTVHRKVA